MSTPASQAGVGGERNATAILLLNQLIAAGAAVLVNILAARVMEPAPRGDLAFALQVSYLLTVAALMGLERPFMASEHGQFSGQYKKFTRLTSPGYAIVGLAVVAMLFIPGLVPAYSVLIFGAAVFVVMNMLVRGIRVAYVTSRAWKPFVTNGIGSQVIVVLGAITLSIAGVGAPEWWMCIYVASGLVALTLLAIAVASGSRDAWKSTALKRDLRLQGVRLFPAAIGNTAMVRSDRLLLPILGTSADLGLYVTVATVMEMAVWPVQQWVDVSLRRWSAAGGGVVRMLGKLILIGIVLSGAVSAVLGFAAYLVVTLFLPTSYGPAVSVIVPLGIASMLYAMTRIQQGVLISLGATGSVSIVETIGWAAAITAYVLLIPNFGIMGAAIGSIIGYGVCAAVGAWVVVWRARSV